MIGGNNVCCRPCLISNNNGFQQAILQPFLSAALNQCATKELKVGTITENAALRENLAVNCIPADIFTMTAADYEKFLKERRILMAKKIKEYYNSL